MMNDVPDNARPKRERTPGRAYAWRERSWCRPRKQRKHRSSHHMGHKPVWRERSVSFSRSPENDEGEAISPRAEVKMLPGEEVLPSSVREVESAPSPQFQATRSCQQDVLNTVCQLCGGVRLCGAALEELEGEVDRILAESGPLVGENHEPLLRRLDWSQIWPGNPYWQ